MNKSSGPKWILSDDFGISIDSLNWKLLQRRHDKKTGEPTGWIVIGYYPNLKLLAEGMQRRIVLMDSDEPGLSEHLQAAVRTCQHVVSALSEQIDTLGRVNAPAAAPSTVPDSG